MPPVEAPIPAWNIVKPSKMDNLILPQNINCIIEEWITEIKSDANLLRSYNIEPRRSALFFGQPGCGKTSLAKNIATKLDLSLAIMKVPGIMSRYVGDSEKQLATLFGEAAKNNMAIFLDEIDCLASNRDKSSSTHYQNLTIALLGEIDNFKGVLIAATNRHRSIDDAVWRRFDIHIEIPAPDIKAIQGIIKNSFLPFELPDEDIGTITALLDGVGASLIKQIINCLKRKIILSAELALEDVFTSVADSIMPPTSQMDCGFWNSHIREDFLSNFKWPLKTPIIQEQVV